ncbi:MAG: hypothetical protein COX44_03210 [Candidatus Portnoybacteria bacterium CG23_combo_of_CG06-09_8_20_14_all_37_13]|uniref:DUF86 domain-containing protein n=1 Tax=Candidatus Portnoybacteria bacterium CG23_combo_of_CG06-09_8_20_14_all_37_13 TaxID=1974819 RepID=A0A2G9YC78_9BACT|nr:MAG: hypothetical protein COX44_03210 [Candidatus Portnoybacteria bacterium CG23_combo_of_CG06-09_8_20_14_all_37_13]
MKNLKVDTKIILTRINIIQESLGRLNILKTLTISQCTSKDNFALAEHFLRYALEATFDICAHILSRIPGVEVGEYKKMALEMGKQKIVSIDFAKDKLEKMAGYRNRLTHFYFEIGPKEMYEIIQNNLGDFESFLKHIKKFLHG